MNSGQPRNPTTFDVVAPTAAELAAAEAELQAIGVAEPLPAATIERMLRGPFAPTTIVPARRPIARTVALAAMLLLAVSGIAWAGMRVVWPVQQNSATTLPLADAIVLATEPNRDDLARRSALSVMLDHAGFAAEAVAFACRDTDAAVAASARSVRDDLELRLHLAPDAPPAPISIDIVGLEQLARNRSAGGDARMHAVQELGRLVAICLHAMNVSPFTTAEGERMRASTRDSLRDALRR